MKLVYNGPQGMIEIRGIGVVERFVPFEADDEVGKDLLTNPMFREAIQARDKPKEGDE